MDLNPLPPDLVRSIPVQPILQPEGQLRAKLAGQRRNRDAVRAGELNDDGCLHATQSRSAGFGLAHRGTHEASELPFGRGSLASTMREAQSLVQRVIRLRSDVPLLVWQCRIQLHVRSRARLLARQDQIMTSAVGMPRSFARALCTGWYF